MIIKPHSEVINNGKNNSWKSLLLLFATSWSGGVMQEDGGIDGDLTVFTVFL